MSKLAAAILGLIIFLVLALQSKAQPALLDSSFVPALNTGAQVYAVALQTNGQILVGGLFSTTGTPSCTNIARLNPDGTLDTTFNPGPAADLGYVAAIAVQKDGKVVIGGAFASSIGITPSRLARLNTNGTVDSEFDRLLTIDDAVNAVAVQPDNKILFAGAFQYVDYLLRRSVARVETNGFLDFDFDACVAATSGSGATALALLSDGKILMSGGNFGFTTGAFRIGIARLNICGDLDSSYPPQSGITLNSVAYALACRNNEKAVLGGNFATYDGLSRNGIAQLMPDGSLDAAFDPGTGIIAPAIVYAIALQSSGKIIIGGDFTSFNGQTLNRLARLNVNGSVDTDFDPGSGPDNSVGALAVQGDGRILVGGKFSAYNSTSRPGLVRLQGDPVSRLDLPQRMADGQTRLVFHGRDQVHYAIEASTNLSNWISMTNIVAGTDGLPITDPEIKASRFYRAVSLP